MTNFNPLSDQWSFWGNSELTPNERYVAIYLLFARRNSESGQLNPGKALIARDTGLCLSTVKNCLNGLIAKGFLKVEVKGDFKTSNKYSFCPRTNNNLGQQLPEGNKQPRGRAINTPALGQQLTEGRSMVAPEQRSNQELNKEDNNEGSLSRASRSESADLPPELLFEMQSPDEVNVPAGYGDQPPFTLAADTPKPAKKKRSRRSETPAGLNFYGLPEDLVSDWKFHRAHLKNPAPLTQTAIDGFKREADKAGLTLEAAVRYSITAGWRGFNASWYQNRKAEDSQQPRRRDPWAPLTDEERRAQAERVQALIDEREKARAALADSSTIYGHG